MYLEEVRIFLLDVTCIKIIPANIIQHHNFKRASHFDIQLKAKLIWDHCKSNLKLTLQIWQWRRFWAQSLYGTESETSSWKPSAKTTKQHVYNDWQWLRSTNKIRTVMARAELWSGFRNFRCEDLLEASYRIKWNRIVWNENIYQPINIFYCPKTIYFTVFYSHIISEAIFRAINERNKPDIIYN